LIDSKYLFESIFETLKSETWEY